MLTRKLQHFLIPAKQGPFHSSQTQVIKNDKCHVVFIPLCDRAHLQSMPQGGIFIS